ncbi:CcdB family protein [Accumulibacter sp.]|uniref:CcdB family protein n=1 Tax=Accumulibacter sp. TaxID=2053492 RepID=UPI0025FE05F9|nr:CcdB family protein [Accumulibacter sp.]
MAQFSVHRNPNPDTSSAYPLLLDVQSDLVAELGTRVAVPLCPAATMTGGLLATLTPVLEIDGRQYLMLTPQLAGIQKNTSAPRSRISDSVETRSSLLSIF